MKRSMNVVKMLSIGTVVIGVLAAAAPAQARLLVYNGTVGFSSITEPGANCTSNNAQHTVWIRPPNVLAHNYYSGSGNDWQYVRYMVWVSEPNGITGAAYPRSGWSGKAIAWDNRYAQFTGSWTRLDIPWYGNYGVVIQIQWLNRSGTTVLGSALQQVTQFQMINSGVPNGSIMPSC